MKHSEKTEHISGNSSVLQKLLKVVSGITGTPKGAYNIRQDGKSIGRQSTCLLYTSNLILSAESRIYPQFNLLENVMSISGDGKRIFIANKVD